MIHKWVSLALVFEYSTTIDIFRNHMEMNINNILFKNCETLSNLRCIGNNGIRYYTLKYSNQAISINDQSLSPVAHTGDDSSRDLAPADKGELLDSLKDNKLWAMAWGLEFRLELLLTVKGKSFDGMEMGEGNAWVINFGLVV
ncbi:hypothetical protein BC833DRAFT_605715 [Globomyces pollinis-pini]|nr:hypothetical protein BC833DRAFT_605715 [Globomyces pollinis-pini]